MLRRALHRWYLEPANRAPEAATLPPEVAKTLTWLEKASLPVPALSEPKIAHKLLDALATNMDGSTAAADYIKRRRGVIVNFVRYAIVCGELDEDPFKRIQWTAPKTAKQIDRRRVPNPKQVSDLLVAVSYVGTWKRARGRRLVAFFGCLYYAMMRPEEAIGLRENDCHLPETGWGLLTLHKAKPYAGRRWTDSGELHDDKGLKQRAEGDVRLVPIPPVLVAMLREHIATFGVGDDGRIFRTEHGKPLTPFAYQQAWKLARKMALPPQRV
jgi:integrase